MRLLRAANAAGTDGDVSRGAGQSRWFRLWLWVLLWGMLTSGVEPSQRAASKAGSCVDLQVYSSADAALCAGLNIPRSLSLGACWPSCPPLGWLSTHYPHTGRMKLLIQSGNGRLCLFGTLAYGGEDRACEAHSTTCTGKRASGSYRTAVYCCSLCISRVFGYPPSVDTLVGRPTFDDAHTKLPGFALFHHVFSGCLLCL